MLIPWACIVLPPTPPTPPVCVRAETRRRLQDPTLALSQPHPPPHTLPAKGRLWLALLEDRELKGVADVVSLAHLVPNEKHCVKAIVSFTREVTMDEVRPFHLAWQQPQPTTLHIMTSHRIATSTLARHAMKLPSHWCVQSRGSEYCFVSLN